MKKLLFFIILGNLYYNNIIAQGPQEEAIMMHMLGLKTALIQKDSVSLSKLLSDDVSYGHSNGLLQTRSQLIRDVVSGVQDYKSIDPSDLQIRIYDKTAIVTMKSGVSLVMQGKPMNISMNVLLVWVWKDNDWKLVARQSVKNN